MDCGNARAHGSARHYPQRFAVERVADRLLDVLTEVLAAGSPDKGLKDRLAEPDLELVESRNTALECRTVLA
jgi:hypothetical protein